MNVQSIIASVTGNTTELVAALKVGVTTTAPAVAKATWAKAVTQEEAASQAAVAEYLASMEAK